METLKTLNMIVFPALRALRKFVVRRAFTLLVRSFNVALFTCFHIWRQLVQNLKSKATVVVHLPASHDIAYRKWYFVPSHISLTPGIFSKRV